MGIEIEKKIDFQGITAQMKANASKALADQLELEKAEIIRRSLAGVDADGEQFEQYTEKYLTYKTENRKRGGNPNLWLEGGMLQNMTTSVETTDSGYVGKIFFTDALQAAKARGNNLKRKFFALSQEQLERLSNAVKQALRVN